MLHAYRIRRDLREQRSRALEELSAALSRSQAVIEFNLDGTILSANANFLATFGYQEDEVIGHHHSMFVSPDVVQSDEYTEFWATLGRGKFVSSKFLRFGKHGQEIWLQATYNPILSPDGRPYKVVKLAVDISTAEEAARRSDEERAAFEHEQSRLVSTLAAELRRLAQGDLTSRIEQDLSGAGRAVKSDYNNALESLQTTVSSVGASAGSVRSSAAEIARASDDLSRRTEQQAAGLEETAAALDEVTATAQQSAAGASYASSVAADTRAQAERSGEVVGDAVSAMTEIKDNSDRIAQIIGVIDEIALQTNLLALNAGVEAARAGDAGKGFAVVASEVRALAQRSAAAAKEIKTLINASSVSVERGVALVARTGEALSSIVANVSRIDEVIASMASSSQEQAAGLREVNTAVNRMDQVTQQNAAMVEQTTAAAAGLRAEAEELAALVARFKVDQTVQLELADPMRHGPGPNAVAMGRARLHGLMR